MMYIISGYCGKMNNLFIYNIYMTIKQYYLIPIVKYKI